MALISTMAALVLSLLIASANTFYNTESNELTQISAEVILLDRLLSHYGPDTMETREQLRSDVVRTLDLHWPKGGRQPPLLTGGTSNGWATAW